MSRLRLIKTPERREQVTLLFWHTFNPTVRHIIMRDASRLEEALFVGRSREAASLPQMRVSAKALTVGTRHDLTTSPTVRRKNSSGQRYSIGVVDCPPRAA